MANVGKRILAFVVDNVIKFAYILFVFKFFELDFIERAYSGDGWTVRAIGVLLFLPITFYSLYSEILMNGQTIGKKLLKIKVINIDGFKPSTTDYVIRWFLRIIDFNLATLIFVYIVSLGIEDLDHLLFTIFLFGKLMGFLLILFTKNNQRFGDIMANTVVIYLKDQIKFSDTIIENIHTQYVPTYPTVINLSDNDARIIKDTFKMASKHNDYKTLIRLRSKIQEVTGITAKVSSDKQFIDTVLKDYNYYTQNM